MAEYYGGLVGEKQDEHDVHDFKLEDSSALHHSEHLHQNTDLTEEPLNEDNMQKPMSLIPGVVESVLDTDDEKIEHAGLNDVPIDDHAHENNDENRPGVFQMPLTRQEYGNEDYAEERKESVLNTEDYIPLDEPSNENDAEPESLSRKLEKMSHHETNYPVPYRSKLTEPFEPGQTLIVRGKTVEDSVRFTISLHTASADFSGNDVPLHISVRFDEGKIVFNTFSKGEWGKEERKSNPYKKGDPIDIRVRAHDNRFTITTDQKEIKEYEHRVPLSSVTHFSIDGDIFVSHISWSGKYYPVPYESGIPGEGLAPGKTLLIYGTPEKKGKRFHINLLKKNGDIALHFNPRFDEKHIIRNSLIANEWGNEEREGKVPLEKGVGFDLKIVNEEYAFQVFLNDERYCTYAHRLEPHDLNGLQIGGDVEITGIQIF